MHATWRCCASATADKSVTDGALPHVAPERLLRFAHDGARFDDARGRLYCCAARVAEWQTQGTQERLRNPLLHHLAKKCGKREVTESLPGWRNWQTRRTQNPVGATPSEFDSRPGHLTP